MIRTTNKARQCSLKEQLSITLDNSTHQQLINKHLDFGCWWVINILLVNCFTVFMYIILFNQDMKTCCYIVKLYCLCRYFRRKKSQMTMKTFRTSLRGLYYTVALRKQRQWTAGEMSFAENVLLVMVSNPYRKYKIVIFHYHQSVNVTFAYTVDCKSIHASRFCRQICQL